jgi:hypothetical protein
MGKWSQFCYSATPSEKYSKVLQRIVDPCRSLNPNDRPSSGSILKKFPARGKSSHLQDEVSGATRDVELGLSSMRTAFTRRTWCSLCWACVQGTFFHCIICHDGDFDICSTCCSQRWHCYDEGHLLVEIEDFQTVSRRYHSMVRKSGTREIAEL